MIRETIAAAAVLGAAYWLARMTSAAPAVDTSGWAPQAFDLLPAWGNNEPDQTASMMESVMVNMSPSTYAPADVPFSVQGRNERAFLDMIAYSEGTAGHGDDGYNVLFGYGTFDSYADHPRIYVPFGKTNSSAAGRYQILARTWDSLKVKIDLPDFSPASQDAAALELIRERGALNDVRAGRITSAIDKCRKVWASLPGAGYGQPERKLTNLMNAYASAGGTLESTT